MSDLRMPPPLSSTSSLPNSISSSSAKTNTRQSIAHAASEFESILLGQWLQSAQDSFGSVPGADDEQDAGDAQMRSYAVQVLGKAFTQSGGIGLSSMVEKALEHGASQSVSSAGQKSTAR